MILVTGATGKIGRHLVGALAAAGTPVRVMAREGGRAGVLKAMGAELAVADFSRPETLDAALAGVEKAFLLPPPSIHQFGFEAKFVDAAKRAGVRHLVKLSIIAADPKSPGAIAQWHGMAERRIEDSGLPFTHIRPNFLMQNLLVFAPHIRASGHFELPLNGARVALIDARDIAAAAAAVLTGTGHDGKIYTLTGGEAPSAGEMAATLSAELGRKVEYIPVACNEFKKFVLGWGVADPYADAVVSIWHRVGQGNFATVTDDLPRLIGRPPITFAAFAHDHAPLFGGTVDDRAPAQIQAAS